MRVGCRGLSIAFLSIGGGLRLLQYIANPAQWTDELMLTESVVSRPMWQLLTTRLANGQSAPPGMLAAERLAYLGFGASDLALRAYSFACSVIALIFFYKLAGSLLRGASQPIAAALFATATPLILFSNQAKQYSSDVAVALALYWLSLRMLRNGVSWKSACVGALVGIAAMLFSQPAVFVLAGGAVALLWNAWLHRAADASRWRPLGALLVGWGLSALLVFAATQRLMTKAHHEFLYRYWAAGFMPTDSARGAISWLPKALRGLFLGSNSLMYPLPMLCALLAGVGGLSLWQRERLRAAVVLLPFLLTLAAAILRLYPFTDRLILFLVPTALLCVAEAIGRMAEVATARVGYLGHGAIALTLLGIYPLLVSPPPYAGENIKPLLERLRERRAPGDAVYIYYGAAYAVRYYGSQYDLRSNDYDVGACSRRAPRSYLRQLDGYRGKPRVWVVIAHSLPQYGERENILRYLDAIGTRRDSLIVRARGIRSFNPDWADMYLYDLSDARKLTSAFADTFELGGSPFDELYDC